MPAPQSGRQLYPVSWQFIATDCVTTVVCDFTEPPHSFNQVEHIPCLFGRQMVHDEWKLWIGTEQSKHWRGEYVRIWHTISWQWLSEGYIIIGRGKGSLFYLERSAFSSSVYLTITAFKYSHKIRNKRTEYKVGATCKDLNFIFCYGLTPWPILEI